MPIHCRFFPLSHDFHSLILLYFDFFRAQVNIPDGQAEAAPNAVIDEEAYDPEVPAAEAYNPEGQAEAAPNDMIANPM